MRPRQERCVRFQTGGPMPSESLDKNLGIDWKPAPPSTDDWDGPVSEEETHKYNIEQKALHEAELAKEDYFAGMSPEEIQAEYDKKVAEQQAATIPQRQI